MVKRSVVVVSAISALAAVQPSAAKTYFKEQFNDEGWQQRWTVPSKWKSADELGDWAWTAGKWHADETTKGIQTSQDSRFYGLIAPLSEPFTQEKDLVLQFSVKHENKLDCGGAYIKLLGPDVDTDSFGGDTPYQIMFGPDICGQLNARTHVIFHSEAKDDNLLVKHDVRVEKDNLTHVYTLHVKADGTYEVYIDQQSVRAGKLEDDFDFLEPRTIKDPDASKPEDWVDEARIIDHTAVKPEGYDDIPEHLPDPDAVKPDVWDEEEEGEWEPPVVPNPAYKGPWAPQMIDNPDYKGAWVHPEIANPAFKEDANIARRCKDCTHIGFEIWQVKSGTIFDDIIVTDSLEEAQALANEGWATWKDAEKAVEDEISTKEHEERKIQMAKNAEAAKFSSGIDGFNTDDIVIGDDKSADEDGAIDIDQDWKADEL